MHRGYIKIWRKVEDSGLMQMPNTLALFMFLLLKATHKPKKLGTPSGVIDLERGQFVTGRIRLSVELKQSEQQIRTGLERLEKLEIITSQATNRYTVYSIVNYSNYQDIDQQDNQPDNQQITNNQPTDNQQITTKQTHKHISTINKPLCASSSDDDAADEKSNPFYTKAFLAFWGLYPTKKSKGDAAKAFAKIKSVEYPAIRAGLEAAIASPEWKKNNGQFIPHPGTWLRARGWEDERNSSGSHANDPIEAIKSKYPAGTIPAAMDAPDRKELLRLHSLRMDGRLAA